MEGSMSTTVLSLIGLSSGEVAFYHATMCDFDHTNESEEFVSCETVAAIRPLTGICIPMRAAQRQSKPRFALVTLMLPDRAFQEPAIEWQFDFVNRSLLWRLSLLLSRFLSHNRSFLFLCHKVISFRVNIRVSITTG